MSFKSVSDHVWGRVLGKHELILYYYQSKFFVLFLSMNLLP